MEIIFVPGLILWSAVAFFGTRRMFLEGQGPLCEPLGRVKETYPAVLPVAAGVGLIAGFGFAIREIAAVRAEAGLIGGSWLVAVICAVAGATALSAHLFLSPDA